jgi:hypothetical protein
MNTIRSWAVPVLVALTLGGAGAGVGCSSESAFCEAFCACEQCDDSAREQCHTELSSSRSYARSSGCEEEYEAYLDCGTEEGTCVAATYAIQEQCAAEYSAFSTCLGGGGPE